MFFETIRDVLLPTEIKYNGQKFIPMMAGRTMTVTKSSQKGSESVEMPVLLCIPVGVALPSPVVVVPWEVEKTKV